MKKLAIDFLKGLLTVIFSLIAPIILVIVGALIAGYGLHKEWEWMTSGGVIVAALGLMLIFRYWWLDD